MALKTWDSTTGLQTLDTNWHVGRVVGTHTIPAGSNSGSINVPAFAQGNPFWTAYSLGNYGAGVTISRSGNTLSWVRAPGWAAPILVIYGVG